MIQTGILNTKDITLSDLEQLQQIGYEGIVTDTVTLITKED